MKSQLKLWVFLGAFLMLLMGSKTAMANDVYIAQTGGGAGSSCSSPLAVSYFNTSTNWTSGAPSGTKIGPGTTVHLCGTFTGTAGSTMLTAQGSGSAGNPITIKFESGAVLTAPYWAHSVGGTQAGAITLGSGLSYITIDGGTNGIIQNTANGSSFANQQPSTGISAFLCSHCTVQNLTISNLYVQVVGDAKLADNSVVRAVDFTGSNWSINNNTIHDCGWCVMDSFSNGDSNVSIFSNNFYAFGHATAVATSSANAITGVYIYGNHFHDPNNWADVGCNYHDDGLHAFGVTGSSIDQLYLYNNLFDGNWGTCPTGFVFVEAGGSGSPANLKNSYWWNNVMIVPLGSIENTNGWFNISSGNSGVQEVLNNTMVGPDATDNTNCMVFQNLSGLTFENNTVTNCGDPVYVTSSTLTSVDYNFYGPSCQNGNNCFVWNGSFTGSFSSWKSACACDSHSYQNNTTGFASNGVPAAGSPVIGAGINLISIATGSLATLSSDTSLGNSRVPIARPSTGAWDIGAYLSVGLTVAPSRLTAAPN